MNFVGFFLTLALAFAAPLHAQRINFVKDNAVTTDIASAIATAKDFATAELGSFDDDLNAITALSPYVAAGKQLSLLNDTKYTSAREIRCEFAGFSLVLDLGFAGSGDCFSPLPKLAFSIKPTYTNDEPTTQGLALLIAKNSASAAIQERIAIVTKTVERLRHNPLYLFGIKTLLLAKDHHSEPILLRHELAQLLLRLSITPLPGSLYSDKALSSFLPIGIQTSIKQYAPELLDVVDISWSIITGREKIPQLPLKVCAVGFYDKEFASTFFLRHKTDDSCSFIQDAKAELDGCGYKEVGAATLETIHNRSAYTLVSTTEAMAKSSGLPTGVLDAITGKNKPGTQLVQTDTTSWVVQTATSLTAPETVKYLIISLLDAFKQIVTVRNDYLSMHPTEAEAGQRTLATQKRLAESIATFRTTNLGSNTDASLDRAVKYIIKKHQSTAPATTSSDAIAQYTALKNVADDYTQKGLLLPDDIKMALTECQSKLPSHLQAIVSSERMSDLSVFQPLAARLSEVYTRAAEKLAADLVNHEKAIAGKKYAPKSHEKTIALHTFNLNTKIPGTAYVNQLKETAALITKRFEATKKLAHYRRLLANKTIRSSDLSDFDDLGLLELEVGWLMSVRTPEEFCARIVRTEHHFDIFKRDFYLNDATYKEIRWNIADQFKRIFRHSSHMQENLDIYRYAIALYAPGLLTTFDQLTTTQA